VKIGLLCHGRLFKLKFPYARLAGDIHTAALK